MLSMIALSTKYRTLTNPATAETSPNTAIALLDQRVPGNDQTIILVMRCSERLCVSRSRERVRTYDRNRVRTDKKQKTNRLKIYLGVTEDPDVIGRKVTFRVKCNHDRRGSLSSVTITNARTFYVHSCRVRQLHTSLG